jgi:hypothetical protein
VTPFLYMLCGATAALLILLAWALRNSPGKRSKGGLVDEQPRSNIQYFPQIQQALSKADREFLFAKGGSELAREVARERRKAAMKFVSALDQEFSGLLRLARVIAALSPEVAPMEEFERVRLSALFHWRLQTIRVKLAMGAAGTPELSAVSNIVSRLSVRMEAAMKELGERATLAAEMASAIERRNVHLT